MNYANITSENYQTLNPVGKKTSKPPSLKMTESPAKDRREASKDGQKQPFESIITKINKQDTESNQQRKSQTETKIVKNANLHIKRMEKEEKANGQEEEQYNDDDWEESRESDVIQNEHEVNKGGPVDKTRMGIKLSPQKRAKSQISKHPVSKEGQAAKSELLTPQDQAQADSQDKQLPIVAILERQVEQKQGTQGQAEQKKTLESGQATISEHQ